MSELLDLNLVEASKALKNKKISSLELTNAYLKSINDTSSLGAYPVSYTHLTLPTTPYV